MKKIFLLSIIPLCFACSLVEPSANCSLNPPHVTKSFFQQNHPLFKKGMIIACHKVDDGMVVGTSYESPTYKYAAVMYKYHDTSVVCSIIRDLANDVIATFKPSDSCYFILAPNNVLIRKYDSLELSTGFSKIEREMLVPYLGDIVPNGQIDSKAYCGLIDDYTILLLKSCDEDIVTDSVKMEFACLPSNLKHGYRGGVAYSFFDKTIIFWAMAW